MGELAARLATPGVDACKVLEEVGLDHVTYRRMLRAWRLQLLSAGAGVVRTRRPRPSFPM